MKTPQEDKSIESVLAEFDIKFCIAHTEDWIPEYTESGCEISKCLWTAKEVKAFLRQALNDQKAESYEMGRREAVEEIKEKLPSSKPILHVTDDGDGYEIDEEYISDTDERFNSCLKEISDLLNTLK